MNKLFLTLFVSTLLLSNNVKSQDTVVVQTLNFSDITKRRGWYIFPADTNTYQKILMYYTLKCDAATTQDAYPCGEWDYTTYTNLYQYKNIGQPYYWMNGDYPDTVRYTTSPTYTYYQQYEQYIVYDNVNSESGFNIGSGNTSLSHPFGSAIKNAKTQYLYTAAELLSSGLTAGTIDKLKFDVIGTGSNLNHLKIIIKHSIQTTLDNPELTGFTEVYNYNTSLTAGLNELNFTTPFLWDGTSNIIIELSYNNTNSTTNNIVSGETTGFNSTIYTTSQDGYLNYDGMDDYVEIPDNNNLDLSSNFSLETWIYPTIFSANFWDNTIIGKDADENSGSGYVLRCGGAGILNFNLGTAAGWKEVSSTANALTLNTWQHVAATYDGSNLKIYVNGIQVGSAANTSAAKPNSMALNIGAGYNGGQRRFNGKIDDVKIWSTTLSMATIAAWQNNNITGVHPNYANLIAYYKFDNELNIGEDSGLNSYNSSTSGFPIWQNFKGAEIFKNLSSSNDRPNLVFTQGDYNSHLDSTLFTDTIQNSQATIIEYNSSLDLNEEGIALTAVDTTFAWNSGWSYTYDANQNVIDSVFNAFNVELINEFDQTTYQLQNYVTPYGIGLNLGANGFRWVYDVTDYAPLFHDTLEISAGNQQELIDLKFIMIKGTPPREAIEVNQVWLGDWQHADIANDVVLPNVNLSLNPAATQYRLKTRTTGHWFGGFQNCAEFCPKYHNIKVNGTKEFEWLNWKTCADNPVIAQGGTWIYDRAGWCPGTFGDTYDHELTPFVSPGATVGIDYGMNVTAGGMEGNYRTSVQLISYGPTNFTLDAAIDDIVSPNDWEFRNRINPICADPKIIIQNTGSTTLFSLDISYKVKGGVAETYTWNGTLNFLEKEEVTLPIGTQSFWNTGSTENVFEVSISNPNGGTDEYAGNNSAASTFIKPVTYIKNFFIQLTTNLAANENSYTVKDDLGNIVASRSGMANSTTYKDTLNLPNGCYVFDFYDTGDDGLSFFANSSGNGSLKFFNLPIPSTLKSFPSNFGSFIKYYFIMDIPTGENEYNNKQDVVVYPNPSKGMYNIYFNGYTDDTDIEIYNAIGKKIMQKHIESSTAKNFTINLENESNGIYFLRIISKNNNLMKQIIKN